MLIDNQRAILIVIKNLIEDDDKFIRKHLTPIFKVVWKSSLVLSKHTILIYSNKSECVSLKYINKQVNKYVIIRQKRQTIIFIGFSTLPTPRTWFFFTWSKNSVNYFSLTWKISIFFFKFCQKCLVENYRVRLFQYLFFHLSYYFSIKFSSILFNRLISMTTYKFWKPFTLNYWIHE